MRNIALVISMLFMICSMRPAWYAVVDCGVMDICAATCDAATSCTAPAMPDDTDACGENGCDPGYPCCCNCLCFYDKIDRFAIHQAPGWNARPLSMSHHFSYAWVMDVFHPPNNT